MEVIDKINELLAINGLTGADLSRAIGVSSGAYSQWNRRTTRPSNKTLKKIADYFGITVSDILAGCSIKVDDPDDATREEALADLHRTSELEQDSCNDAMKFALFGTLDVTDETYAEVKRFAKFALEQQNRNRDES